MRKALVLLLLIVPLTPLLAEVPQPGLDPPVFRTHIPSDENAFYWAMAENMHCRTEHCDVIADMPRAGRTDAGEEVTYWIGHYIVDPNTDGPVFRIWYEMVYVQLWTNSTTGVHNGGVDYSCMGALFTGVNFWDFVEKVVDAVEANKGATIRLDTPGFYGVHLNDYAAAIQTAAPARLVLTAKVKHVPRSSLGEVELVVTATLDQSR